MYRQTLKERNCLVYSFASTLDHIRLHQITSEIYQAANVNVENTTHFIIYLLYWRQVKIYVLSEFEKN